MASQEEVDRVRARYQELMGAPLHRVMQVAHMEGIVLDVPITHQHAVQVVAETEHQWRFHGVAFCEVRA